MSSTDIEPECQHFLRKIVFGLFNEIIKELTQLKKIEEKVVLIGVLVRGFAVCDV